MKATVNVIALAARLLVLGGTTVGLAQPFGTPPVEFASVNGQVITVRVPSSAGPVKVQVGRPSPELWRYLYEHDLAFAAFQLESFETLLVRAEDGKPVTSAEVYTPATYAWQATYNLVPIGSDYSLWRTTAQQARDTVWQQQLITPVVEALEFVRNTAAKAGIAVASGGATAPVLVEQAIASSAVSYVKSMAIDGVLFGKKAQRASAFLWAEEYLWAKDRQIEAVNDLADGVVEYDPRVIASRIGAANMCAFSDSRFIPWRLSLYPVGESLLDSIGKQVGEMAWDVILGEVSKSCTAVTLDTAASTYAYVYLGPDIGEVAEHLINVDTLVKGWWAAKDTGILSGPSLAGSPFADFVNGIINDCKQGGVVWRNGQTIVNAPLFQQHLVRTLLLPGPINTLVAQSAHYSTVHLRWAAPADDMGAKNVANHQIRYSDAPIQTEADWNRAIRVEKETGPAVPGATVNVVTDDLPAGRTFFFAVRAADDQGNLGPISNSPSLEVGHGINPIGLGEATVNPNPGSAIAARHTYEVSYKHQGGLAAGKSYLFVNGQPHPLDLMPDGNPKAGLRYGYTDTTPYLPGSTVRYHFEFETGPHNRRLPETGELELPVAPVMYGNSVNPAQADHVTLRTFQVWYRNPLGTPPVRSHLRLANTSPVSMRLVRGAPTIGALYEGAAWVSTLNQEYWFDFSDGTSDFRLPISGSYAVGVASKMDVALLHCPMPTSVVCGQVIPIRPTLRNMGTELAQNCHVYLKINGAETNHVTVPMLEPGMSRDGAAAFDWTVPVLDSAQTFTVSVGINPMPAETATADNEMTFTYNVPPGRGAILGYVFDSLGVNPVTGATVQAFSGTNDASSATTDETGYFKIDGLLASSYKLRAERDGQKVEVAGVAVHALQSTDVGIRQLAGYALSQHSFFTGNNNMRAVMVSPFDGMVAYRCGSNRGLYLMTPDGKNPHQFFSDSPTLPSVYPPETVSFSPTRREFVFMGYRTKTDEWGVFRCSYDADGNYVDCTLILDANSFTNPYGIYNPTFLPNGDDLMFFEDSPTDALWQMSRTGAGLQRKVFPAHMHGQTYYYSMSPDGRYLVTSEYVYSLDLPTGTLTNVWAMPADALGGYIPMFTPDSTRLLYTKQRGGYNDVFAVEPFTTNTPMQITFENSRDQNGCLSRDGTRMYYVRTTIDDGSNYQLWSRSIEWPSVFAFDFRMSQGGGSVNAPITLDGDGTNDSSTVSFQLSAAGLVSAKIYDCQNHLVKSLCDAEPMNAGSNCVTWNATDDFALAAPFGVYFFRLNVTDTGGTNAAAFTYSTHIPVVYETATLTDGSNGWVAFAPDGKSLYYADRSNNLYRLDLWASNATPVGIQNVKAFDVNGQNILVMSTNATGKYDFKWYSTNGSYLATWVTGVSQDIVPPGYCSTFPSANPTAQEFVYADETVDNVGGNNIEHWNLYKCTGPGSTTALATGTDHEFAASYDTTGTSILYAAAAGLSQPANVYEMNTSGGGVVQRTTHPRFEFMPKSVPGCSRLAFVANWALGYDELWTADRTGGNPWWLLPAFDAWGGNYSISSNADLLAYAWPAVKLAALPEHLNKGSVRGRVIDDTFGAGLVDVPIRAVQGNRTAASTRSNARGYFKLVNVPPGNCDVVAGGGLFLETLATNVSVAVARVAEAGGIRVTPTPAATLVEPGPNSVVGPQFGLKVEPSDRCVSARVEWRRNTSDSWALAGILTADQLFAANFPAALAGWTAGDYVLRATGFNVAGVADPNPSQVTVTFQPSSAPLTLTLDAGGGARLASLRTAKGSPDDDVAVQVFEVKPPGGVEWQEIATIISTEGAEKQVSPARLLAGATTQFRVRSYDSVGNESVSSILSFENPIVGDRDADGMPDDWEQRYSLDSDSPADGPRDADGDGLTNLQEYLLQLDPNQVDAPRIVVIAAGSEGTIRLRIEGVYGRGITVEVSEDLVNWALAANPVSGEASVELEVATPVGGAYGFYRAVLR